MDKGSAVTELPSCLWSRLEDIEPVQLGMHKCGRLFRIDWFPHGAFKNIRLSVPLVSFLQSEVTKIARQICNTTNRWTNASMRKHIHHKYIFRGCKPKYNYKERPCPACRTRTKEIEKKTRSAASSQMSGWYQSDIITGLSEFFVHRVLSTSS